MDEAHIVKDAVELDEEKFIADLKEVILDAAARCRN